MLNYVIKRLFSMIPVLVGISILLFFMLRMLPGDPAKVLAGQMASPEEIEKTLLHSGARTAEQLKEYCDKVQAHRWTIKNHAGADSPLGVTVYAMLQERATFYNYQETRARIRAEYGLPQAPTEEERTRGYEVGASEAFRVVGVDEIAHHGIFLQIGADPPQVSAGENARHDSAGL